MDKFAGISEKINIGIEAKGHVKFELFDAVSGELQKRVEDNNGITRLGLDLINLKIRSSLMIGNGMLPEVVQGGGTGEIMPFVASQYDQFKAMEIFRSLVLTDDNTAFNVNDSTLKGTVTGLARRRTTNGTDPLEGALNLAEMESGINYIKMIFDFPSDRAIGTHRAAHLIAEDASSANIMNTNTFPKYALSQTDRKILRASAGLDFAGAVFAMDDNYFYAASASALKLYKYSRSTGFLASIIALTGFSFSSTMWSCVGGIYNGYLYGFYSNTQAFKINLATGVCTSIAFPSGFNYKGVVIGNYLYYIYPISPTVMYRYNLATEAADGSKTFPSSFQAYPYTIYVQGGVMYLGNSAQTKTYTYNWDTNTLTEYLSNIGLMAYPSGWEATNTQYPISWGVDSAGDMWFCKPSTGYYRNDDGYGNLTSVYGAIVAKADITKKNALATSKLVLATPVVKTNAQTMKVTYTLTFNVT